MGKEKFEQLFESIFFGFLNQKGFVLKDSCFTNLYNGVLVRIYPKIDFHGKPDVIVLCLPDFCDFTVDFKLLTGFSVSSEYYLNNSDDKFFVSDSLESDMRALYNAFVMEYDKYFYIKSVDSLAKKYMKFYDIFREKLIPFVPQNEQYIKKFLNINCFEFAYFLYRTANPECCKNYLTDFVNIYREYLYSQIQYKSLRNLENQSVKTESDSLNKVYSEYCRVTEFAEALYDGNKEYFQKLDEQHRKYNLSNREYLKNIGFFHK